jgi:putative transcriptional regulator
MTTVRKAAVTALLILLLFALLAAPPLAAAGPTIDSLTLVARPQLRDPLYARTVLVVAPFGADQHYGFIVNRPTRYSLGQIFPRHAPSQKVAEPVFLGGPVELRVIFALVAQPESPGPGSMRLMPGLYATFHARTVDRIIESKPDDARFVTGLVVWRPGELARELAGRMWYVLEPDASLAMREPRGLWEELVVRAQRFGRTFQTSQ